MTQTISFVVAARNDDFGGSFLHRMRHFLEALFDLGTRYGLAGELVVVEWNPPPNRSSLANALAWPTPPPGFNVRIICVPNNVHETLPNSDRMSMFEYVAKNVGVRRARGDFVLTTNPDIIFNHDLVRTLSAGRLSAKAFYRVDRYDVFADIPLTTSIDERLEFCDRQALCIHRRETTMWLDGRKQTSPRFQSSRRLVRPIRDLLLRRPPLLHMNAAGDFFLMSRDLWHQLRGHPELPTHSYLDGYLCSMAASGGIKEIVLGGKSRIYHQEHHRLDHAQRPKTDWALFKERQREMFRSRQPWICNDEWWGLGKEDLTEISVTSQLQ